MFTGSIVVLVMPMDEDGNVCRTSLKRLTDYHVANGTLAIASVGTTGEPATLNHEEHGDVVMMMLELIDGRIPAIADTGANAAAEVISLIKRLDDSGAVDYLTVTPYYNRPAQEGLLQYSKAIAEHTDLPQILYSVPSHIGCDMLPEIVGRLVETENIVGIKEIIGNLSRVHQIKEPALDDFILLSGDDVTNMDFMQLGGVGVTPVTANVATREMADMCRLALAGQSAEVRAINQYLTPLHTKLLVEPNSIPVRWGCKVLGLVATDTLRSPMTLITNHGREAVTAALKHAGLL